MPKRVYDTGTERLRGEIKGARAARDYAGNRAGEEFSKGNVAESVSQDEAGDKQRYKVWDKENQLRKHLPGATDELLKKVIDKNDLDGSYKNGGKVRKTGIYRLHKGERVLNSKQTKKYAKKRAVKR